VLFAQIEIYEFLLQKVVVVKSAVIS